MENETLSDLELLAKIVDDYRQKSIRLPDAFTYTRGDRASEDFALRKMRRYLKNGDHIMFNVAIGWFPGVYGDAL